MKKILCTVLALLLCVASCAMAESVPSKTTEDFTKVEIVVENTVGGEVLEPVESEVADAEVDKLMNSESIETYFIQVKDVAGNAVDLSDMLDLQDGELLNVHDFTAVNASGFSEECGAVTATLAFPTLYAENEKVIVLIGFVNVDTVEWIAFEGIGAADGSVKVTFPEEMVMKIQNGDALMAVVSK